MPDCSRPCECGCGGLTNPKKPRRFIAHHASRLTHLRAPFVETETGCWEWQAAREVSDYGVTTRNGKKIRAHRALYEDEIGPIPPGYHLHHICENRPCVNPGHLVPLTPAEHAKTKKLPKGTEHHKALLTEKQVHQIRSLCDAGWIHQDIADAYGVKKPTIQAIGSRRTWRHLPEASHA